MPATCVGRDGAGGTRVLLALLAVLSIIIGLWAVRHVLLTRSARLMSSMRNIRIVSTS